MQFWFTLYVNWLHLLYVTNMIDLQPLLLKVLVLLNIIVAFTLNERFNTRLTILRFDWMIICCNQLFLE